MRLSRKPAVPEHAEEYSAIVHTDDAASEAEPSECVRGGGDELDLCEHTGLADDVDIGLHELPVSSLLRSLGAPDGCDLYRPEHWRQLRAVRRVEPRERNGEVEPQTEVGKLLGIARLCRGLQRLRAEPSLENREGELLVIAPEARMKARVILDHGRFDLVESVRAVHAANDPERVLTAGFVSRKVIAHAARRVNLMRHGFHSSTFIRR